MNEKWMKNFGVKIDQTMLEDGEYVLGFSDTKKWMKNFGVKIDQTMLEDVAYVLGFSDSKNKSSKPCLF